MKKLVFAAAVVAAAFGLKAELASANVVGYNTTTHRAKYTLVVPEFASVGEGGLDLQSIKPDEETIASYGAGNINIQTFDEMAAMSKKYYYFSAEESDDEETAGWYSDINGITLANKTFTQGEGFMLYMPKANGSLMISGEVSLEAKTVNFRAKYTLTGNFRPTAVNIQDLLVPSETLVASYGAGNINIQTFDEMAAMSKKYYYFSAEESDDEETAGWYSDINGITLADKTFQPGEGFMIYMPVAGDITFKAISLSDAE